MAGKHLNGSAERFVDALRDMVRDAASEAVEKAVEPLRADVAELKTDMAEVKADVAGLKMDMVELRGEVAQLHHKRLWPTREGALGRQTRRGRSSPPSGDALWRFGSFPYVALVGLLNGRDKANGGNYEKSPNPAQHLFSPDTLFPASE